MKTLDIIKRANKNLLRSKTRTILTILAIFIGAFTLTLTLAIGQGAQKFITDQTSTMQVHNTLIVSKSFSGSGSTFSGSVKKYTANSSTKTGSAAQYYLSQADITTISNTEGITGVIPSYFLTALYITRTGQDKYILNTSGYNSNVNFQLEAGSLPAAGDSGYIIIPANYVKVLGFANPAAAIGQPVQTVYANTLGQTVTRTEIIKGILVNSVFVNGTAYISQDDAKSLYAFQNMNTPLASGFSSVFATYSPSASAQDITDIKNRLAKESFRSQTFQDAIGQIQSIINTVEAVLSIFAGIAILASTFGITNTLIMSIFERKHEIGLMKALGMGRTELFKIFAIEATSIGFWGGILGITVAMIVGKIANRILSQTVLKDFYNYELLSFTVLYTVLVVLFLMLVGFLAGTIPAIRASRLDPIEALHEE